MDIVDELSRIEVVDLAHPLSELTPSSPNAPGFRRSLMRRHGDIVLADDVSFANDMYVTGTHVGTHIDALSHVSCGMELHGGHSAADAQLGGSFSVHGIEDFDAFLARGVLFDIPRLLDVEALASGQPITADMLRDCLEQQGREIRAGDIALVRSGWSAHVADRDRFVGLIDGAPGIDLGAAEWLSEAGVRAVGGETIALEVIPAGAGHASLPVHRHLIVDCGISIVEVMRLDDLAILRPRSFAVVMAPLQITGATGSPVRPLALVADR